MLNSVILNGRLVHKPTSGKNSDNLSVCRFRIAVERDKRKDEEKAITDFINCSSFGKTADFIARWFKQGDPILISGRMQIREYESPKYHCKIREAFIFVKEANFSLARKQSETNSNQQKTEDLEDKLMF